MRAALADFKNANRWQRLNRVLQFVLSITFIVGLNYLALRHFKRLDITLSNQYTLSPETKSYIKQIDPKQPVRIYNTFASSQGEEDALAAELAEYTGNLLEVYKYYARQSKEVLLTVENVDLLLQREKAAELAQRFEVVAPNTLLIESGDNRKVLVETDLAEFVKAEAIQSFKVEQAVTSAIMELTQAEPQIIYFVSGHNEMSLEDVSPLRGLSELRQQLELRGFRLGVLDLMSVENVPEDAGLVVLAAPSGKYFPQEISRLRKYLDERAGRVMMLLEFGKEPGLDDLLFDWGLRSDRMVVVDPSEDYDRSAGYFVIRQMAEHPITQDLLDNQIVIVAGFSRPVRQDLGAQIDDSLTLEHLFGTSKASWAESSTMSANGSIEFDPKSDLKGPVPIAAIAERKINSRLGLDIPGGRIAVFGCADVFSNQRLSVPGNQYLMINTFNWLLDRENLLSIPPRPVDKMQITITKSAYIDLTLWMLAVPVGFALLGFGIMWLRRH